MNNSYRDDPYAQDDGGVPDAGGGYDNGDAQPDSSNDYGYEEPYSYGGEDNPDAEPSYYGNQSQYSDYSERQDGDDGDDDDEYYYDGAGDDEYLDDEGKPLSGQSQMSNMSGEEQEYYNDEEYPDEQYYYGDEEDDEERRRRARRRRAMCCCLILLCCLLLLIILLIFFLLNMRQPDVVQTLAPTYAPFIDDADDDYFYDDDIVLMPGVITTPMAPFNRDCEDSDGKDMTEAGFRSVFDQCACEGEIYFVPQDVQDMREILIDRVGPKFYDDANITQMLPLNSCDPKNLAFLWLASGDNRDAGEPRQRYMAALTFFQLNGTIWDFHNEWLGELNECLWMGIQCNNRDTVNSLAVDTNNLFGEVRGGRDLG
ncbi:MAG: hypothetical protein SGILL_004681 [Bacillariaceae sp.]